MKKVWIFGVICYGKKNLYDVAANICVIWFCLLGSWGVFPATLFFKRSPLAPAQTVVSFFCWF
jgi:hypothetical protein